MNEQEKARLRAEKEGVTARLGAVDAGRYRLAEVDARLDAYVREVCSRPAAHNLWEQLSVERFLRRCRRYGINVAEVRTFYRFYESLYFPGKSGHRRYRLTPVQCFQFCNIFGFWSGGRRVTRQVVLFVPRKFSKTTSTAALALYDLLYGEANAESYTGANSQDQAKKCFDVIRGALRRLDPKQKYYTINEQEIKSRRTDRSALSQCLTANARTKDGLNASLVIMDEYAQARDSQLLDVLTTSMGVRDNPLTVIITTASSVFEGPFYAMLEGCKRVLLGEMEQEGLFAHLFEPDVDDEEGDPATWAKVQPHLGVTVNPEFYREEWEKARASGASEMTAFRTKLLNIYATDARRSWLPAEEVAKVVRAFRLADLPGRPGATVAVDLSVRGDLTAVSTCVWRPKAQEFYIETDYFFPRGALEGHPNEMTLRAWAEAGHITLLDGDVMDYRYIARYVMERSQRFTLLAVGYDAYKAREMVNILQNSGLRGLMKPVSQTYAAFTSVCMSFETGVFNRKIFLNDNPINLYCVENAVLDRDRMENMKPVKRQENRRIDGLITALMSLKLWHELRLG